MTAPPRASERRRAAGAGVATVLALSLAACSSLSVDGLTLNGTSWRAVSVAGNLPVAGSEPTLTFELGGQIDGSTGCNTYASNDPIAISGNDFRGGGSVLMTLGACVGEDGVDLPVMAIERAFSDALSAANRIGLRRGALVLAGPRGELVFERVR